MAWFNRSKPEQRASLENPSVPISDRAILSFFGVNDQSIAGEVVSVDTALGVPSIWAAVNFLSGTIAGLPLNLYRRKGNGRQRVKTGALASILHDAVNDDTSSFDWRKHFFESVLTHGRGFTYIERNAANRVVNLWPLDPTQVTIRRLSATRRDYFYNDDGRQVVYKSSEVIDVPFLLKHDRLRHYSPIFSNQETVAQAIALTKYGSRYFQGGGVPPFMIEGPFNSGAAMERAADDLSEAVQKAAREKRLAISLPKGHTVKQIGTDPDKSQLLESQRFSVEQVARIYSMPPTFLQDLTNGTFSNTEQQDLHFVKHTLKRWVEQFEQEINLKIFGRSNRSQFIEFEIDGLLRGDFKTRMEGYSTGIQNSVFTPNEARQRENLPDAPEGNSLLIQGATVPLGSQPKPGEIPKEIENDI